MEAAYFFWQSMLDGAELGVDVHNDGETVEAGFYRTKEGEPVAIWFEDGEPTMTVKGVEVPAEKHVYYWQRCMTRPVEEDTWRMVAEQGGQWPDMDEAVAETLGDNIAGATDPETLEAMLARLEVASEKYQTISTDDDAERAQSLRSRILELSGRADKLRTAEKAPHLEAERKVDAKWQPMIKRADSKGKLIRTALGAWEDVKRKAAAQALADANAKAQAIARASNVSRETPVEIEVAEPPKPRIKGGYGRAASARVKPTVTSIDPLKVFPRYAGNAEVIALLTKLAQADVDIGLTVPGATVEDKTTIY